MSNFDNKLMVSHAPHIRGLDSVQMTMLDVIIAIMPSLIAGVLVMGYRASVLTLVCVASAVFFEWAWQKVLRKPSTIYDLSAVVTGILLALNLPVTLPFWMAIVGSFFAIIIVKQFFGGLGHNFMNPALAARAFLLTSWALPMTTWIAPFQKINMFNNVDVVSHPTPLALIKGGAEAAGNAAAGLPSYMNLFLGNVGGCIGETSALAILIGAGYLIYRRVINLRTPLSYILTVAVLTFAFGGKTLFSGDFIYHLLAGGLLFGAFFMATDYTTTPYTPNGQIVFGIGCGILTAVIRLWGGYPEGVSYSILLMNITAPLIDKLTAPKRFGGREAKRA